MTRRMRYNVLLIAAKDDETGDIGLTVEGTTVAEGMLNAASNGTLIAHDLIEHVNGVAQIGSINDELEALGAIWYVRGQHNDLSRDGSGSFSSVEKNISFDVVRMFREWFYGAYLDTRKRYTRPCDGIDDAIYGVLRFTAQDWPGELGTEHKVDARKAWRQYAHVVRHNMRTGYRKAYRRWEPLGCHAANSAFWAITEAINSCLRRAGSDIYEGQQFRLTYDSDKSVCAAQCKEAYEHDDSDE